jgi:hypothetical protein
MTLAFPTLVGMTFPVVKRPTMSSIIASHPSGREVRYANYQYSLYEWEMTFEALTSASSGAAASSLGAQSLQSLMGFFQQLSGQWGTFTYLDPTDNSVTNQFIATGNAVSASFPFVRTIGGFTEPVSLITTVSAVKIAGVVQPSTSWSATTPNTLTFASAPTSGAAITSTFSYQFLCRPSEDQLDFEEFYSGLWEMKSFKFTQVRTS